MTNPGFYLWRMLGFLAAVLVLGLLVSPTLATAFLASPVLNGAILALLGFGIGWNLLQVVRLRAEAIWVEAFRAGRVPDAAPGLLAPMAQMLSRRGGRVALSPTAMRSVLDGISGRLDETRELSRYMIGLSIFLGLLGTFWGLIQTVGAVAAVIQGLSIEGTDLTGMFDRLKAGLAEPLSGMGTAFSSSLFGLAGALVLGFLDLACGQAQTRFFTELEDWLAGVTRLSFGLGEEGEATLPEHVQALLAETAENLAETRELVARGEAAAERTADALGLLAAQMAERDAALAARMAATDAALARAAEAQAQAAAALLRLAERAAPDPEVVARLGEVELLLARLVEETGETRARTVEQLQALNRTLAALAAEPPR
jgi:hypothetical protein